MSLVTPRKGYKSVPWLFGKEIEIPEEWKIVQLEKYVSLKHGFAFNSKDFIEVFLHFNNLQINLN